MKSSGNHLTEAGVAGLAEGTVTTPPVEAQPEARAG